MPLYEYRCPECGSRFEEIRSLRQSDEEAECPACGASAARQLSSFATATPGRSAASGGSSCGPGRGFT